MTSFLKLKYSNLYFIIYERNFSNLFVFLELPSTKLKLKGHRRASILRPTPGRWHTLQAQQRYIRGVELTYSLIHLHKRDVVYSIICHFITTNPASKKQSGAVSLRVQSSRSTHVHLTIIRLIVEHLSVLFI